MQASTLSFPVLRASALAFGIATISGFLATPAIGQTVPQAATDSLVAIATASEPQAIAPSSDPSLDSPASDAIPEPETEPQMELSAEQIQVVSDPIPPSEPAPETSAEFLLPDPATATVTLAPGDGISSVVAVMSLPAIEQGNSLVVRPGAFVLTPDALQGPDRPRTVLPGSDASRGIAATVSLRQGLGDNQTLVLIVSGGERILAFDFGYVNATTSPRRGFAANIFNQRSQSPAFRGGDRDIDLPNGDNPWVHRLGGGVELFQPLAPNFEAAFGVSYQRVSVRDDVFTSDIETIDELGNQLTISDDGQDDLLTLNLATSYDTRDSRVYATEGTRLRFGIDQSIPVGDADIFFTRLGANATQFIPLNLFGFTSGPRVLVLNFQAGTFLGDDVPAYEAFNLGGISSVRGYTNGDIGTGRSFIQASVEYRFPIANFDLGDSPINLAGALFVDYANALGSQDDVDGEPGEVRDKPGDGLGAGIGLHAVTPFGLARLEFGVGDEDVEVYFTFGDRF